jgi:hypothetical protein
MLRFALAGGPARQLLRPAELEEEGLADAIQQRAMFDSPRLFERHTGIERRIESDALVLKQDGGARISIDESGRIELRLPLERRTTHSRSFGGLILAIIQESVLRELGNSIAFSAWLLDHVDATQRISHAAMSVKIDASAHLGWRTQAEQDASPNAATMRMGEAPCRLVTLDRPRGALKFDAARLAEDLMVPLRRQWKS